MCVCGAAAIHCVSVCQEKKQKKPLWVRNSSIPRAVPPPLRAPRALCALSLRTAPPRARGGGDGRRAPPRPAGIPSRNPAIAYTAHKAVKRSLDIAQHLALKHEREKKKKKQEKKSLYHGTLFLRPSVSAVRLGRSRVNSFPQRGAPRLTAWRITLTPPSHTAPAPPGASVRSVPGLKAARPPRPPLGLRGAGRERSPPPKPQRDPEPRSAAGSPREGRTLRRESPAPSGGGAAARAGNREGIERGKPSCICVRDGSHSLRESRCVLNRSG